MSLRNAIIRQKIFFQRGHSYFGVFGVGYLVASQLSDHLSRMGISVSVFVVFPIAVFIVWLIGRIEFAVGLFQEELRFGWESNPAYKNLTKGKTADEK